MHASILLLCQLSSVDSGCVGYVICSLLLSWGSPSCWCTPGDERVVGLQHLHTLSCRRILANRRRGGGAPRPAAVATAALHEKHAATSSHSARGGRALAVQPPPQGTPALASRCCHQMPGQPWQPGSFPVCLCFVQHPWQLSTAPAPCRLRTMEVQSVQAGGPAGQGLCHCWCMALNSCL